MDIFKTNPFILLSFFILLLSCNKDSEEHLSFPVETRLAALESQDPVRVFTKSGEVSDPKVIGRFIAGATGFNSNYAPDKDDIVIFLSDSTAQIGISAVPYTSTKTEDGFTLSSSFSAINNTGNETIFNPVLDMFWLCKHTSQLETIALPGGATQYKGKQQIILYGDYKSFKMPALCYKIKRVSSTAGGLTLRSEDAGIVFNEFNDEFLSRLGEKDTVAVQQSWLRFKK